MSQFYDVGKIVNTHGIKGELKILSVTDFPEERYRKGSELFLKNDHDNKLLPVTVESARLHKNTYIVKFKEFTNINEVERFKGASLQVSTDQRIELEDDEFYYDDIIGCEAWTDEGQLLGKITEILTTGGANDVWVVDPGQGKEILLPYIDDCILEIDIEKKKIKVHLLEGLME
jgi:16S rRNA processing protein RimM